MSPKAMRSSSRPSRRRATRSIVRASYRRTKYVPTYPYSSYIFILRPSAKATRQSRPPNADLYSDSDLIRSYVTSLARAGRTVLVLMHSYGGHVGTDALEGLGLASRSSDGLPGGVSHLVYMVAFAMSEGGAMMDKVEEFGHKDLVPLAFDFADDGSCVHREPRTLLVGPVSPVSPGGPATSEAEVDAFLGTLVRWNGRGMYLPVRRAAWRGIPSAYIHATDDVTVPLDYQKSFVEAMRGAGREVATFELATGHCPQLTATEGVVDAINKIVEG